MKQKSLLILLLCGLLPLTAYAEHTHPLTAYDLGIKDVLIISLIGALVYFSATVAILRSKIKFLQKISSTDDLTNIWNRRAITQKVKSDLSLSHRMGTCYSVAVCDIDFFKEVNDTYGHDVGDKVLKQVAHILSNSVRESDTVGRVGGEEFVVLMPNTSIDEARFLLTRLQTNLATANILKTKPITVSIGVTEVLPTDMDFLTIFKRADDALYDAKNNGRNRVEDK